MVRTKPALSKVKSNRSRTVRAKKIKESWRKRKNVTCEAIPSTSSGDQSRFSPIMLRDLEDVWDAEVNSAPTDAWGSDTEFEKVMAEKLEVEVEPRPQCKVNGRRVVDVSFLLERTIDLAEKHARNCTSGKLLIENEKRRGMISTFSFKCNMCDKIMSCSTENPAKSEINKAIVWGTIATGSTYKHTEELLSTLDIPPLSNKLFYAIQEDLGKIWMDSLYTSLQEAGAEEHKIALEKGNVDREGIPWITVYLDGGWSKRSYGHNYDAASGVGVIIGRETKKGFICGCTKQVLCNMCKSTK